MSEDDLGQYRPYPEYRESGVEWLGEIPEHWTVTGFQLRLSKTANNGSWGDELSEEMQSSVISVPILLEFL